MFQKKLVTFQSMEPSTTLTFMTETITKIGGMDSTSAAPSSWEISSMRFHQLALQRPISQP